MARTSALSFIALVLYLSLAFTAVIAAPVDGHSVAKRSVSEVVKPVLKAVTPLTNGLDNGLTQSAGQIESGVNSAGKALNSVTSGVGDIAEGTVSGLGNTLADLPKALYGLLDALQNNPGLVGSLLNALTR